MASLWFHLLGAIGGDSLISSVLGPEAVGELLRYIVYSVVFAWSTAVLWWFGDRAMTPPGFRNI